MAFITEWNQTAGAFTLPLRTGYTYNMVVDWGDGSPTSTVTAYNAATATHTYATAGTFQISITGTCQAWYINDAAAIKLKITKVIDWGNVGFTAQGLYYAFLGATNLTQLPAGAITGAAGCIALYQTFKYTGLNSLPSGLLDQLINIESAVELFMGCPIPSIPSGFFDYNTKIKYFNATFRDCTLLENCPEYLFRYNTAANGTNAFYYTFYGCNKLKLNKRLFFAEGEEATRFLNQSVNFNNLFYRTAYTGAEIGEAPQLWLCNFGTGTPVKTSTFGGAGNSKTSLSNYCYIDPSWGSTACAKLEFLTATRQNSTTFKIGIGTSIPVIAPNSVICYASLDSGNIVAPQNLVTLTTQNNIVYEATLPFTDGQIFYIQAKYLINGTVSETLPLTKSINIVDQKPTTVINVVPPNYKVLSAAPQFSLIHGFLFYNGYLYGSARDIVGSSVLKLKSDDFTTLSYITAYSNKTGATGRLSNLENIVLCGGFIWCLSNGILIRINPSDLDYMTFSAIGTTNQGQPIGTDGTNLYITTNTAVYKVDTSLLLGSFASYGYTGAAPVVIPPAAILGNCQVIQKHATEMAYLHSIAIDSQCIYMSVTTSNLTNGYDTSTGQLICHFQKVDKVTMSTVGDVTIPQCTDDMVQNAEYVFIAPEVANNSYNIYGNDFGLMAIKKSTLEIKYLKALHQDFNVANEIERASFGVQYFGKYVIIQLKNSFKSIVINTENVDLWNETFPIGGATTAVWKFQKDAVDITSSPNELVMDDSGNLFVTTWATSVNILRFTVASTGIALEKNPNLETILVSKTDNSATLRGYIIDEGQSPITSGGFKYGTDPLNLTNDLPADPFSYDFTELLAALDPDIYYFAAYGTNTEGTFLGNTVMFAIEAPATFNAVSLHNNDTIALLEFLDTHFGCSVRCVQDAPGVPTGTTGTAQDQDGNVYDTVVINEKRWMVQNLKTTHFRNGDPVPNITDPGAWQLDEIGAQCAYNNKPANV